jgi:two-component system, OmpR family, alkaline phosphatase synthesis response regulator PhoP
MTPAKRILIVDDDAFIRRPLEFILREEGFEPYTAADGEECLRRVGDVRPDLIFLDVMMPGRDGFAVCGALKCDPQLRDVPVILLSARGMESDRQRGLDVGAADFMTKPYSPTDLVRRVRELLHRN